MKLPVVKQSWVQSQLHCLALNENLQICLKASRTNPEYPLLKVACLQPATICEPTIVKCFASRAMSRSCGVIKEVSVRKHRQYRVKYPVLYTQKKKTKIKRNNINISHNMAQRELTCYFRVETK